jgi:hypothetical protein
LAIVDPKTESEVAMEGPRRFIRPDGTFNVDEMTEEELDQLAELMATEMYDGLFPVESPTND